MSAKKSFNGAVCFEAALTGLTLLFLMVPVIQMVITAFTVNAFRGIKSGLTTQWLVKVLELYGDTIVRSLGLALMTLIVCVIVGVPAAWVLVREQRKRWAAFVEEAFILPLSMPGLAVGLGILLIWGGFSYFRQSIFFLLAGHVMFCLPFMVRSVTAVLRVEPLSQYEEASATLGASAWTTFRRVVVPVAMPGILAGALMVVTVSLGEFNISWMLQTPYTKTLPVGLADSYASMRLEVRLHIHLLCHLSAASHAHAETSGTPEQTPCAQKQIRTGKEYGSEPQSGTGVCLDRTQKRQQALWRDTGAYPLFAHDGSRLPYRAAGTFRLRQNNAAAHDCGPGNSR